MGLKVKLTVAISALALLVFAYVAYWISQHPGIRFIGSGETVTSKYISESGHYRSGVIAAANFFENAHLVSMQGVEVAENFDAIWGVTIDRSEMPVVLNAKQLETIKTHLLWKAIPKDDTGSWIEQIYGESKPNATLVAFTAEGKYGLVEQNLLAEVSK